MVVILELKCRWTIDSLLFADQNDKLSVVYLHLGSKSLLYLESDATRYNWVWMLLLSSLVDLTQKASQCYMERATHDIAPCSTYKLVRQIMN